MASRSEILIVGGGVAGLSLATRLGKSMGKSGKARITLIDKSFSHVWKPMLHCFASGTVSNENDKVNFISQASGHHFEFWPGEVASIDRENREVVLSPLLEADGTVILESRRMKYDTIVIAIGSTANDFGTPGVKEHCMSIDNLVDANAFNEKFRMELLRAFANNSELDIAIVGGGATGVQLAAELHKALEIVGPYNLHAFGKAPPKLHVTLLQSGARILPAFPESVSAAAQQELEHIGVTVRTNARVAAADEHGFTLKDGSYVSAKLRVWAAGVRAPEVTTAYGGLTINKTGQILVNPNLSSIDDERIFAMGDCSFIQDDPLPATAQVARQQARHLARHLPAWIEHGQKVPGCIFHNKGAIVALGKYNGWAALPGGTVWGGGISHGFSARMAHLMLYRQHQIELFGYYRGLMSFYSDWVETFVRPSVRLD
ncbi:pyridine nucleotide-disulfide oxidoreductase [Gluconobacter potus]|uniref:NADH dehydrogenase type II n=4 Tax=Gluconobacter TaxID=441 RepID=A0A829WGD6_GLUOY|nr:MULTISPECIES: NAD(P)/FAD-dependent oxidoreductase [Gluconobacter]AHK70480.1 NADH dehydrogenase Ndh [Gluconobacter oxydans DSM 3504]KXU99694.1 pyridine nucleotide-disulfide oxidoreductase [Gluconobacter potus]KXV10221.1 pyridine nucleotide-disulfide oxidoreductase [Gluconobacter oxydans]KXV64008.1 pyridine nucleotide-disulfide oxidoreductase [Gluconobacter oxydans]WKE48646.1 NAD(P)/FAD-dependent oxidoreductase [Gluconobacter oxydans]